MVSYVDLLRRKIAQEKGGSTTQNTYGATSGPSVGVSVSGTQPPAVPPSAPPPAATPTPNASAQATSVVPSGQNARIAELFPEYIDPATGKPYAGPTTTLRGGSGGTGPGGTVGVTRQRTTPETHPWLYPQGGQDFLAGKDYSRAEYAPGGVAQGFPTIPQMSQEQRRTAADRQNYFRNEGQGLDPTLMRGMSRSSRSSPYRNQFGSYTPANAGYRYNPSTRRTTAEFTGSQFRGRDQSGNPFNYTGQLPYGSDFMQTMQRRAANMGPRMMAPGMYLNSPQSLNRASPSRGGSPQFGGPTGGPTGFNQPPTGGSGFNQSPFIGNPQGMPPWLQAIMGQQRQAPQWWQGLQNQMFGGQPPQTGGVNNDPGQMSSVPINIMAGPTQSPTGVTRYDPAKQAAALRAG